MQDHAARCEIGRLEHDKLDEKNGLDCLPFFFASLKEVYCPEAVLILEERRKDLQIQMGMDRDIGKQNGFPVLLFLLISKEIASVR